MVKTDAIKLLAIDDKPDNLTALIAVVQDALPQTLLLTATNGPAGIELAAAEDPDVILLDIVMPGMDGFEVCRRLKADERLQDIPVVFLTALKTDVASRVKALEVGGEGFLAKPLETTELTAQIRAMIKVKATNRSLRTEKARLQTMVGERTADLRETLESLRKSVERYRGLLTNLEAGVVVHAPNTSVILNNTKASELLGLSDEQMRGKLAIDPAWTFIKENGVPYLTEEYPVNQIAINRKAIRDLVLGIKRPSTNDVVWVSINGIPLLDRKGDLFEIVISFVDITERKRADEALVASETRYRSFVQNLHGIAFRGYSDFSMAFFHGEVEKITGYKEQDFLDARVCWANLIHPDDKACVMLQVDQVMNKGNDLIGQEYRIIRKDGSIRWIQENIQRLFDESGSMIGVEGIIYEITERKKTEDALRISKDLLSETERIGKVGGWSFNIDTLEQVWTDEVYRIHEVEISPNPSVEMGINYYTQESRPIVEKAVQHAIEHGEDFDLELEIITAKGNTRAVHTIGKADLKNRRIYGFFQDITERKRIDAYREMAVDILQILNEPIGMREAIERILPELKTQTGADAVGLRLQEGEDFPYIAQDGFSQDFLLTENTLVERGKDGGVCRDKDGNVKLECTCGLVISGKTDPSHPLFTKGGSFWTNDSFPLLDLPANQDPRLHPRNNCIHQGHASVALIPIRNQDRIIGILQINDKRKDRFSLEAIEILEGIAANIGSAMMRKQAEEALRRVERNLQSTVDGLSTHIVVLDESGEIILTNQSYRNFAVENGIEPESVSEGTNYLAVCDSVSGEHSEEAKPFAQGIREVLSGKRQSFTIEYPCHSPDKKRWFIGRVTQFAGEGPRRVIVAHTNITEQKEAEERRQEGFDLLKKLAVSVPGVIYQYRLYPDGRSAFPYSSPGMYDIYEVTPEEVRKDASLVFTRIHPEDLERVSEAIFESARSLTVFQCELRVILPKQGLRWRWSQAHPERTEDGGTIWHGIILDVTERKLAEEELRESKALVEAIVENIPLMIFLKETKDLRFVVFNKAGEELLGYDRKALLGKNNLELFPPEQAAHFMAKDREVLDGASGMLDIPEEPCQTARKGQRLLHTRKICIRGADGTSKYLLGISEDITERKQAETTIQKHAETLSVRNIELERFNRASVGREMRMIELKNEINDLCKQAGLPLRYTAAPQPDRIPNAGRTPAEPSGGGV